MTTYDDNLTVSVDARILRDIIINS